MTVNGAGIILAGGQARRLGGVSKADIIIGAQSCFDRSYKALSVELAQIAVSLAAPNPDLSGELPQILDASEEGLKKTGPAMAILASLVWADNHGLDFIMTLPVDTPFVPPDFTKKLIAAYQKTPHQSQVAMNESGSHWLHALWPVRVLAKLKNAVYEDKIHRIAQLHDSLDYQKIDFSGLPYDGFHNINRPEDIEKARQIAKKFNI